MNPNQHWLTLGAGLLLIIAGGRGSVLGRALSIAAGSALVLRAIAREMPVDGRQVVKIGDKVVASTVEPDPAIARAVEPQRLDAAGGGIHQPHMGHPGHGVGVELPAPIDGLGAR